MTLLALQHAKSFETDLLSITGKKWIFPSVDERRTRQLRQIFDLNEAVSRILAHRLESIEEVPPFLNPSLKNQLPDPASLPDMDVALQRVLTALEKKEKMAIWGDYDVDGATSSALLCRFFRALGLLVRVYIPDRFEEGYGPNIKGFQALQAEGISLIITVDCGTTAFTALNWAKKRGLDVIVIDHHSVEAQNPPCVAIINPKRLDVPKDLRVFETLAAVGLCFLFAVALNRFLRETHFFTPEQEEPCLMEWLDLVALGTVCDVMPLKGLNRVFVAQGLKVMAQRRNLGLKMLSDVGGLKELPTAAHMGFLLGPRINAGGRMGGGASHLGVRLLTTQDPLEALHLAKQLDKLNQERQKIEASLEIEALLHTQGQEDSPVIVVAGKEWHTGVIGIVAGRLKDKLHRPTFVISFDTKGAGKGSARSIPGLDIGALIHQACHLGLLRDGGGHAMAGGFSLHQGQLKGFHDFLKKTLGDLCKKLGKEPLFSPEVVIECGLTLNALTPEYIQEFDCLAPYGMGNAQPRFLFQDLRVVSVVPIGTQHARLVLAQMDGVRAPAIAFRCIGTPLGDYLFSGPTGLLHVVGTVNVDMWGGHAKCQLIIEDMRSAS